MEIFYCLFVLLLLPAGNHAATTPIPPGNPGTTQAAATNPGTTQAPAANPATTQAANTGTTQAPAANPATTQAANTGTTQAPAANPATTQAPAANPATTQAANTGTTQAPAANPATTQAPATNPATTQAPATSSGTTPASPTAQTTCDTTSADRCAAALYEDLTYFLFFAKRRPNFSRFLMGTLCATYPRQRMCVQSGLSTCSPNDRLRHDLFLSAMEFICSPQGFQDVPEALPCFQNRSTKNALTYCSRMASNSAQLNGMCSLASTYIMCINTVYKAKCSTRAASAMTSLLQNTFAPYRALLNCPAPTPTPPTPQQQNPATTPQQPTPTNPPTPPQPTPTTPPTPPQPTPSNPPVVPQPNPTTPAAQQPNPTTVPQSNPPTPQQSNPTQSAVFPKSNLNLKCYVCNSVIPGTLRPNPGCTPDGELTRSNIGLAPCNGPCFSKRDKNPNAPVQRGCAAGLNQMFPGGVIPTRGCYIVGTEFWCFCSNRNNCNRKDMEDIEVPLTRRLV